MKLYVMANGTAPDMPRESLVSTGAPVDPNDVVPIPIMTFLIEHPDGLVLYDTGWSKLEHAPRPWPISDDEMVLSRLSKIGVQHRTFGTLSVRIFMLIMPEVWKTSQSQKLLSAMSNSPMLPSFTSSIS